MLAELVRQEASTTRGDLVLPTRTEKPVSLRLQIKDELFELIPTDPGHKPSLALRPWLHLRLRKSEHRELLTSAYLDDIGITLDDIRGVLELEATHQVVTECPEIGLPSLAGKPYGWYYHIEEDGQGGVTIEVWSGYYFPPPSVFTLTGSQR